MKPVVAIAGRPNVGKSALFNRVIQKRMSIVEDIPGVTRDRITADTEWNGKAFTLVDTGGLVARGEEMAAQVRTQVEAALAGADVVLLVVDAREGILPGDRDVADVVRRAGVPVLLVANKAEGLEEGFVAAAASELGFGDPIVVSAIHGVGIGDLLDRIVETIPWHSAPGEEEERVKVAITGRPNVGKSSLLNRILGEERVIVSSLPGTTRDAVDVPWDSDGREFLFIDTAGIRRRARIDEPLEKYSVNRAFKAVDRSDVVVLVLSPGDGVTDQDRKIAGYVHEQGKGLVLCFNKWDLVTPGAAEGKRREELTGLARWHLGFASYAPVVFTSAETGQGIARLMDVVWRVAGERSRRIPTGELNRVLREAYLLTPPPSDRGKTLRLFYATQAGASPPVILVFANRPELVKEPYVRYLEGRLRQSFGLEGTPVIMKFRKRE
ncbi:MAG: ribosome biogenesis GTPase Der [Ignavibacteriales bacterium]